MRKIRILHVLETVGSGGVEQRRLSLARKLDIKRYEQRLICTQAIGSLPEQFEKAGCAIHEVGVFNGISDRSPYRRAFSVIQDFRPDIAHGAVYEGVALAVVAGRLGGVPIIIGEETDDPKNRTWKGSVLYRAISAFAHHMVAVSPAVELYLRQGIRLPERKVTMIPNGVAEKPPVTEKVLSRLRAEFGIQPGDIVVGTVGRLFDSHKRVSDLIRAIPQVSERIPRVKLLVVGTGPDEDSLRELSAVLGVSDKIIFAGYQGDVRPFYQIMQLFALASSHEAFGIVLVEAMFAGIPVVATRVGGIPGIVDEGRTGFLVDAYRPEQLAESIVRLIVDPDLAQKFGFRGRVRARDLFSEDRYVADVDGLYRHLLSKRGLA